MRLNQLVKNNWRLVTFLAAGPVPYFLVLMTSCEKQYPIYNMYIYVPALLATILGLFSQFLEKFKQCY